MFLSPYTTNQELYTGNLSYTKMAETAASITREKLLPLLMEVANVFRGVPKEAADIKEELERIQVFINDADKIAAAEQDNTGGGIKARVRKLREGAFRFEEVADEYMISEEQQPRDPGCAALPCETGDFIKTLILRLRMAYEIQDMKSLVREISERSDSQIQTSFEQASGSSTGSQNVIWPTRREASLYVEEAEVVGFEAPIDQLIRFLKDEREERIVVAVIGMAGLGKTTLAKAVYNKVVGDFDFLAWVPVSSSYTIEGLLRSMLMTFCKGNDEAPLEGIAMMDRASLIEEVRHYLREKRYLVVFDDVWSVNFWGEIQFAVLDNKKGSRILITSRNMAVAYACRESSFVRVYKLEPLPEKESWELFSKKAFHFETDRRLREVLKPTASDVVSKCKGMPLAIVAIAKLLSTKEDDPFEWRKLCQNISSELDLNSYFPSIAKILGLSYDDLPYYLKPCLLYFGIYPKDYEVECTRLIMQWIAEGFVKYEEKEGTLEKVAEQYLQELINRNLVQVSSFSIDGKAKMCRVHDLLRDVILEKIKDLSFCHFVSDDYQSIFGGMIRRLQIAVNSYKWIVPVESSHVRSLYVFRGEELPEDFVRIIPTKYKLLRVLDFEHAPLNYIPKNLGNLLRLRYLSFRKTNIDCLPSSIGNLQFLETLDLRQTRVREMPREVNKLRKLRHLLANHTTWGSGYGIQVMEGIGGLGSLQTLRQVETDYRGVELIKELEMLKQLRLLGLIHVKQEYGSALCFSINVMQHLKKLYIDAINSDEVIDLQDISSLPKLEKLRLRGKLERLPKWIPKLQNLVKLSLISSKLTDDPLKSLKDMSNLLFLSLDSAYEGESLHFQDGWFRRLKKLSLKRLFCLRSIIVNEKALLSLEKFVLVNIPQLEEVPSGIQCLRSLEVFHIVNMPEEFGESIRQNKWINAYVRQVNVY